MRYALFIVLLFQIPDTISVALKDLDAEIERRLTELRQLYENIEQAKQNAIYLEGGVRALQEQRQKLTQQTKNDSVKTKIRKEK